MANKEEHCQQFDTELVQQFLTTKYVGRKLIYTNVTGSTMDDAKTYGLKDVLADGSAVLAETQTKGRGEGGHIWESQWQGNIYASFVLHRPKHFQSYIDQEDVEFAGSVAVLRALREIGLRSAVHKWKNDVWCQGHKLAGALVESTEFPQNSTYHADQVLYIYGVGVNVNSDVRRHPALRKIATSVRCELGGRFVSREKLFALICNNLEVALQTPKMVLFQEVSPHELLHVGSEIVVHRFHDYEKLYEGVIVELRPQNWTTVVRDKEDVIHTIEHGVSLRPKPNKSVRVFFRQDEMDRTAEFLHNTLCSLLNTSVYDIKLISMAELEEEDWTADTDLLVVGDSGATQTATNIGSLVLVYVQNGGSVLGIASGTCTVWNWIGRTAAYEIETVRFPEAAVTQITCSLSTEGSDKDQTFYSCNFGQIYKIHYKLHNLVTLAVIENGDVIAAYDRIGKGIVGLIGTNVEVTYADTVGIMEIQEDLIKLSRTVHQRDTFIQRVLEILLTEEDP